MNKTSFLPSFQTGIPEQVKIFLTRALIIFICWKLLYHLFLYPARMPDQQLTTLTARTTSLFFNAVHDSKATFRDGYNEGSFKTVFFINGRRAIGIADSCNGLELMVLYTAFLFCIPYKPKKQLLFAAAGIVVIFMLNILRCYALAWLNLQNASLANVAHKYVFTMIIYSLIFFTWVKYSSPYFK